MIVLDWLGDDFPTFPQFQKMLRDYERELQPATTLRTNEFAIGSVVVVKAPAEVHRFEAPVTPTFEAPVAPVTPAFKGPIAPAWTEIQQLEYDGLVTHGADGWEKTAAGVEAERLIEAEIARRTKRDGRS